MVQRKETPCKADKNWSRKMKFSENRCSLLYLRKNNLNKSNQMMVSELPASHQRQSQGVMKNDPLVLISCWWVKGPFSADQAEKSFPSLWPHAHCGRMPGLVREALGWILVLFRPWPLHTSSARCPGARHNPPRRAAWSPPSKTIMLPVCKLWLIQTQEAFSLWALCVKI